ncbi:isoprenylcysteine carboxylmethyltransferase family protein [Vibrio sp. 10N.261.51.F12]|uniref:methyltransferase family protein n=1 Tax=Vibrio sp. 10N.261.51.F12 TaxID=3229679 RepID=UPI00354AF0BF
MKISKPCVTQVRHFINAHKILTPFVVLAMMAWFDFWGTSAWVYLALHGTYCGLWMVKEYSFRDRRFEEEIHPVAGLIFVFGMLGAYWIAPYLIVSQQLVLPSWLIGLSVGLVILGCFFHFVSDAHKHSVLAIRKGLITTGLFSRTRNPNYLGEMLIYLGFALMAQHWLPFVALAYWWSFFIRNMLNKDKSMARYAEFAEWKQKTGLLLPKIL